MVEEVLPGDVYRVVQLAPSGAHQFATTAHVAQLKSWGSRREDNEEESGNREEEDPVSKKNAEKRSRQLSNKYKDYLLY